MKTLNVFGIGLDLIREKEKFEKKHDAANYIKYLENKNQMLISEYTDLYNEYEQIKARLDQLSIPNENVLKEEHIILLAQAVKHEDEIDTLFIDKKSKEDPMYKVYFQELLDWKYLQFRTHYQNCTGYTICKDKLLEVKRLLASKGML